MQSVYNHETILDQPKFKFFYEVFGHFHQVWGNLCDRYMYDPLLL